MWRRKFQSIILLKLFVPGVRKNVLKTCCVKALIALQHSGILYWRCIRCEDTSRSYTLGDVMDFKWCPACLHFVCVCVCLCQKDQKHRFLGLVVFTHLLSAWHWRKGMDKYDAKDVRHEKVPAKKNVTFTCRMVNFTCPAWPPWYSVRKRPIKELVSRPQSCDHNGTMPSFRGVCSPCRGARN